MNKVFIEIVNMSINASYIAIFVMLLRPFFKKAPKWIMGILWSFVGLRLVCPFSVESVLSLIPSGKTIESSIVDSNSFNINSGIPIIDNPVNDYLSDRYYEGVTVPAGNTKTVVDILAVIWLVGIAAMLIYTIVSYIRVKLSVSEAVLVGRNVWQCDKIPTPFILGIIKPKIYLPINLEKGEGELVILHEQAHIKRLDHIIKPISFLLLSLYWFNPILWLTYILVCRDIELACDERVIKEKGETVKKEYTNTLINLSSPRKTVSACPLAFGETGVKERIKGVLSYKKPTIWIIIASVLLIVSAAVCLLTNPPQNNVRLTESSFVINNNAGVSLSLVPQSLNKKSLKLKITNNLQEQITYGEDYYIEIKKNGKWYELNYDKMFNDLAIIQNPNTTAEGNFSVYFPNNLKVGHYRVVKPFMSPNVNCALEFEINESVPEPFTIVDRTQTEEISVDTAFEQFYSDSKYIYEFSTVKSQYVKVIYSNGSTEDIKQALKSGRVKISDLDKFNIDYYKKNLDGNDASKNNQSASVSSTFNIASSWSSEFTDPLAVKLNNKQEIKNEILKRFPDFYFDDFRLDISVNGEEKAVVTVVEQIGEFYTDNAYVLFYQNGKYTEIYDRSVRELTLSEKKSCLEGVKANDKIKAVKEATEKVSDNLEITEQIARGKFDIKTGQRYYVVYTNAKQKGTDVYSKGLTYEYKLS